MTITFDFFNNLPKSWETGRVKHILDYNHHYPIGDGDHGSIKPEMYLEEGVPYLRVQNLSWSFDINYDNLVYISDEVNLANSKSILIPKDILIAKTGATVGKMAIVPEYMKQANTTSSVGKITVNHKLFNYMYFAYLFSSSMFQEQIKEKAYQKSAQPGFNIDDLIEFNIIIPPLNAQNQIANYLDKKTAKINETISKNNKLIELLEEKRTALINEVVTKGLNPDVPMKDSGVEWIGEIPEHWEIEKIKTVSQVKPSNVDKKSKDNEPFVLLCNYTDVYNNEFITMDLDFMKATASYDQIQKLSLNIDDIIITKDSESADDIAVPAIVTEELNNVVCGYHLAVINPNSNVIYPKFLFRSFESDRINKQFELGANGVTRFGLGSYPINNAYVCIPPLNEQEKIANYLDEECSKIFKATEKIMEHIDLLKEYKTSLIHHVVTGKIDVRGEEI